MIGIFASLWRSFAKSPRGKKTNRKPRRPSLAIERLEDRCVPAAIHWINPGGGDWDTPSNWSLSRLPTSGDDVTIPQRGIVVTHSSNASDTVASLDSNASLSVSAGSLTVTSGTRIGAWSNAASLSISGGTLSLGADSNVYGTLRESGGTLTGVGRLTITESTTWTGGTMAGRGSTVVQGGLELGLPGASSGSGEMLDGRTLINRASAVWSGGSFTQLDGSTFRNASGATFIIQSDGLTWSSDRDSTVVNAGKFTKGVGTGTVTMDARFDNTGTLQVEAGGLDLAAGGKAAGIDILGAGTSLQYADNFTAQSPEYAALDRQGQFLLANFIASERLSRLSATINWGDGSQPTAGTIVQNADGSFSVLGSHSYAGQANRDVIVAVTGLGKSVVLFDPHNPVPTTTILTSSVNPSAFDQSVTFTATVSPTSGSGTPTGTVTFKDGSTTLGTSTLSSGTATYTTSSLALGSHCPPSRNACHFSCVNG